MAVGPSGASQRRAAALALELARLQDNAGREEEIDLILRATGKASDVSVTLVGSHFSFRGQDPGVRGQRSEVRGQRSEVRGQRSE